MVDNSRSDKDTIKLIDQFREQKRKNKFDSAADKNSKSIKWFQQKLKDLRYKQRSKPVKGSMITYVYLAKHRKTLPYYDRFPLIILLEEITGGTWLGLNLHYVPPKQREWFLEQILKYSSTSNIANNTRFKVDWAKVKHIKFSEHMIKRYLMPQVRSNIHSIPPSEWINAVNLPTQQFMVNNKKYSSRKVWKNTRG